MYLHKVLADNLNKWFLLDHKKLIYLSGMLFSWDSGFFAS